MIRTAADYAMITLGSLLTILGAHFFKFPNHFTFGGVTGASVVIGKLGGISPSFANLVINLILLVLGFVFIGKNFGIKTVYSSLFTSIGLALFDQWVPISRPLTGQPLLELVFAIALPAAGAAIMFHIGASGGGTDIIAMIIKKYSNIHIGMALLWVDLFITVSSLFVFGVETFLFSVIGLLAKSFMVDNIIESLNLCKYFNVVSSDPEPICDYITNNLNRSATLVKATGVYSHEEKYIIMTAMRRSQAICLRRYVKQTDPHAFILITSTSEIIGKGF